jgi:WD40 repeat protein
METGACQQVLKAHTNVVDPVAFSADGKKRASASDDRTVRVRDAHSGECLHALQGHSGAVTQVEFRDADTGGVPRCRLVSSSEDGTSLVWDTSTGAPKDRVSGEKLALTTNTEQRVGRFLVTAKDNLVLVHHAHGEANAGEKRPVDFFPAPSPERSIDYDGDNIGVGCANGAVLHLHAAWLIEQPS